MEKQLIKQNKKQKKKTFTLGETKMPEPIIFPTMRQTPWRREISCFSFTPLDWELESASATIMREMQSEDATQRIMTMVREMKN